MNITDILNATDIIEITPVKFIEAANINVATPMLVMFFTFRTNKRRAKK